MDLAGYIIRVWNKLLNIIKKAYVTLNYPAPDYVKYEGAQITYFTGHTKNVVMLFPYGWYAEVPLNTKAVTLNCNAEEANCFAMAYSSPGKLIDARKLNGDVIAGNKVLGNCIRFGADGIIEIFSKGIINVNGTTININGQTNLGVGGQPIARVGDTVTVDGVEGTITSGSSNNRSN